MSCFFDTNVLVYVFDKAEPAKQELVTEHMGARDMVLSTQVLQDLCVVLTRKKRLGAADALEVVTTLAQERIVPASTDTMLHGAVFRRLVCRRALRRPRRREPVGATDTRTPRNLQQAPLSAHHIVAASRVPWSIARFASSSAV